MQFSRLEWREILRCIQETDCDEEVVAKVQAAAQSVAVPLPAHPIVPPNAPEESVPQYASPSGDSWKMVWEPWMGQTDPRTGKPFFTPEEVDHVNQERAVGIAAGQRMAQGIPYTLRAPPEIPAGHGIVHTHIGNKNRVGDVCVALRDPVTGAVYRTEPDLPLEATLSIFECRNGDHGYYADENPARAGCPKCFFAGGRVEDEPEEQSVVERGYQDVEAF